MRTFLVYHIEDPMYPKDLNKGYVGVTYKDKGVEKRFNEHRKSNYIVGQKIRSLDLSYDSVNVIFEGSAEECYSIENKLRPSAYLGWNIAMGGGGPLNGMTDPELKDFRSITQSARMANLNLRKQQGEAFKKNYYNNKHLQKIRKQRAIEHMSDPIKRTKCLNAMHKHVKCPYCEFTSNKGNVTQHIKRNHNNEK